MIVVRDTWRAVLAIVVGVTLIGAWRRPVETPAPPQPPAWQPYAPAWQPQATVAPYQPQPIVFQQAQPGPLRRVAREFVDLAEAAIGVVR